jgi:hypothetical protein
MNMRRAIAAAKRNKTRTLVWAIVLAIALAVLLLFSSKRLAAQPFTGAGTIIAVL